MRTLWIAALIATVACGSSKSDGKADKADKADRADEADEADKTDKTDETDKADKPDEPAVKHTACADPWVPDADMPTVSHAESSANVATLCLEGEELVCYAINLETGQYDAAKADEPDTDEPPPPPVYSLAPPASRVELHVQRREETLELCDTTGQCRVLTPSQPGETAVYGHIDATATTGVLTVADDADKHHAEIFDRQTNRKKRFPIGAGDWICGEAYSLGDVVLAMMNNCAGPAGASFLYRPNGELIGQIGGEQFGTNASSAIQVSTTEWAFNEESGTSVVVVDVTTGKVTRTIELSSLYPKDADGAPMLADPYTSTMVRGPGKNLTMLYGGVMIGHAVVIDPAAGKVVSQWEPPACKKG